jgi:hypothetical protein
VVESAPHEHIRVLGNRSLEVEINIAILPILAKCIFYSIHLDSQFVAERQCGGRARKRKDDGRFKKKHVGMLPHKTVY